MIFKKKNVAVPAAAGTAQSNIIDIHTHLLPGIDDGSKTPQESLEMLEMLAAQGIKTAVATPHYYATEQSPEKFLAARKAAAEKLTLRNGLPRILYGAEVLYFRGISRMENIRQLCIEGTDLLLLEMPTDKWSEYMLAEISQLQMLHGITVVMAHIERYFSAQPAQHFDTLLSIGAKFQINAASFTQPKLKRRLAKMLKSGQIHFIGSDCHNTADRAPSMAQAEAAIEALAGSRAKEAIENNCKRFFN